MVKLVIGKKHDDAPLKVDLSIDPSFLTTYDWLHYTILVQAIVMIVHAIWSYTANVGGAQASNRHRPVTNRVQTTPPKAGLSNSSDTIANSTAMQFRKRI